MKKTRHHTSSGYLPVILLLLQFSRMKYWVYRLKIVTFTLSSVKPKVFSRHLHKDSTVIHKEKSVVQEVGFSAISGLSRK